MKTVTSRTVPGKNLFWVNVNCFVVPGEISSGLIAGGSYTATLPVAVAATPVPANGLMNRCKCRSFGLHVQRSIFARTWIAAQMIKAERGLVLWNDGVAAVLLLRQRPQLPRLSLYFSSTMGVPCFAPPLAADSTSDGSWAGVIVKNPSSRGVTIHF